MEAITGLLKLPGLVQLYVRSLKFPSLSGVDIFFKMCGFQLKVAILLDVRLLFSTPDNFLPFFGITAKNYPV